MYQSKYRVRRALLRATIALPIYSILPITKAEPVTTAVAIGKVVAAVVSALAALAQSRSDRALKTNVELVLQSVQIIIDQQKVIIQELQKIQKLIVEASLKSWQDAYSREIDAFSSALRVNLADLDQNRGVLTPELRGNFLWVANGCALTTNSAGKLDPFTFCFYITGVGVVLVCERVLNSSPARLAGWKAEFVKPVNRWLDAKRADSMPAMLAQTTAEIKVRKEKLASRPSEYLIGTHTNSYRRPDDQDTSCVDKVSDIVTIHGDYAMGFSGTRRTEVTDTRCHTSIGREPRGRMFSSPNDFTPAAPSEFPYINELNAERDAIRNLELAEIEQRTLLDQMEKFRKLLTSGSSKRT